MSVLNFILCLIVIAVLFDGFYTFPIRHTPKGINEKKIKIKHFAFLFYIDKNYFFGYLPDVDEESKCQNGKPYKEMPVKLFVCLIIGYTINFLACIAVIICFCINIDVIMYVVVFAFFEFILLGIFAAIM